MKIDLYVGRGTGIAPEGGITHPIYHLLYQLEKITGQRGHLLLGWSSNKPPCPVFQIDNCNHTVKNDNSLASCIIKLLPEYFLKMETKSCEPILKKKRLKVRLQSIILFQSYHTDTK